MMQPDNSDQVYRFLAGNGAFLNNVSSPNCGFPAAPTSSTSTSTNYYNIHHYCSFSSSSNNNYNNFYPLPDAAADVNSDTSPQDRALAALKNHKEAEKRRRERINSHLDRLRTLLPCNSKTDKASLLAKVVQRVKELKEQTSEMRQLLETLPSEIDEISVLSSTGDRTSDGRLLFKASLCCEDRSDLIPDLIEILNSLHLKTIRAEMATLGGRIRNVLIVAADKDHSVESIHFLQNAFKSLLERSNSSDRSKRRRVLDRKLMLSPTK